MISKYKKPILIIAILIIIYLVIAFFVLQPFKKENNNSNSNINENNNEENEQNNNNNTNSYPLKEKAPNTGIETKSQNGILWEILVALILSGNVWFYYKRYYE